MPKQTGIALFRALLILSLFVGALLFGPSAPAQTLTVDRNQVIGGSTQTVTVTYSCPAPLFCSPGYDHFAFPILTNGTGGCDNGGGCSGSFTLLSQWVNCGGIPPNPPSCAPFRSFIANSYSSVEVDIYPNQINISVTPTQFGSGSQRLLVQGTLEAPVYQQTTLYPFLYCTSSPCSSALQEDSNWVYVNLSSGQSSFSQLEGTLSITGNQTVTVTDNYLTMGYHDCALDSNQTDYTYSSHQTCQITDVLPDYSNGVFLTVSPQTDPGPCIECEAVAGQPINLTTGDIWTSKTDYSVPGLSGGLSLTRTWNSLWNQNNPPFAAGMFGIGWTSDFEERLQVLNPSSIKYWRGTGNTWAFSDSCNGCGQDFAVVSPPNEPATLSFDGISVYTLQFHDGRKRLFNAAGYLTTIQDPNGNSTIITYDSSNRITRVTAPGGQWITFTYGNALDPARATVIQDSVGNVATYTYSNSLLTNATYPDGGKLNYSYDANNNIASITDDQGKIVETHTYDAVGHGLTSSRAGGVDSLTVQYPSNGSTTLTDSNSNTTTYTFSAINGSNYIAGVQGPGCDSCGGRNNQSFTQDTSGNRLSAADPNGNTVSYTYDGLGDVLTRTDAIGTWTYTYNYYREVLTAKDPLSNITTNTYDANGNLLTVTTPSPDGGTTAGSKTLFAYDTKGQLTTITDPLGNVTTLTYFSTGLLNTIKDAQRNITTYGYDNRGNRTSVKDALNNTTTFTYDSMNRLTKITYPNTTTNQFAYDKRGRRTSVTDANNKTTTYAYDDADRLTSITDAANNITSYAYDTENNLTGITDALNRTTTFSYDFQSRLTKTIFPSTLFETYFYDNNGNLTSKTDRNNNTILYQYDQLNRLKQKTYPDSTVVTYTYDADSQLKQVLDPTGTYQFSYDNMGRLIGTATSYSFLTGRTFTTSYGYDKASNRTSFTDPESGATAYAYDSLNRLTTLTPPAAISSGSFGFAYDALSRRTSLTRPNSVTTSYSYDNLSRLLSVLHKKKTTTLDGATYAVDSAGNRTSKTDNRTGVATNYGYDAIYQLLSATQGATTTESYTYDPVGNRLSDLTTSGWSNNASNELASRPGVSYTFDNDGNELTKVDSTGTTSYTWDFENRLASVVLPGSGGTVQFSYDPFGRRIKKMSTTGTSNFAYDGDNLLEEANATGGVVARYSQGLNIDEPLAMLRSSATSFYHADGLGSVTSLSNAAGSLGQTYTFDSFGKKTASSGSLTNPFQYTGRESDAETGLYFYRARYYDLATGRFLSEDPAGFNAGFNFYLYVLNRPTSLYDPFGTDARDVGLIVSRAGEWTNALVLGDLRRPGSGHKSGVKNNMSAFGQMVVMALESPRVSRIPYFGCGQQADYVLYGLTGLLNRLRDNWSFSKEEGFLNLANYDLFWHQRIRASSPNPSDPDIIVDPWLNQFQTVPKGGNPTQQGWQPLR